MPIKMTHNSSGNDKLKECREVKMCTFVKI